jgi:PAS domain S-box-containing protein
MGVKPGRILLAEDDEDHVFLMRRILSKKFSVDVATSGREVLRRIEEGVYDLVLLDYVLPDMSGFDVLKAINEYDDGIPVIMISGAINGLIKTEHFHRETMTNIEKKPDKHALQLRVEKTKDYLQRLLDFAPMCIITTDVEGRITSFNKHAEEVLGKYAWLLHPEKTREEGFRGVLEEIISGKSWEGELLNQRKNGDVFPIHLRARDILNEQGRPIGILTLAFDITEKKKLEKQLREYPQGLEHKREERAMEVVESNGVKDLFSDILRHDLLNPIGVIRNYAELLREEEKDEGKKKDLGSIIRTSEKLIAIIKDASKYEMLTSIEDLELEEKDLTKVFREVIKQYSHGAGEKGIKIDYLANDRRPAMVHFTIEDVFANLLSNAIKYSPPNSTIKVDIEDMGRHYLISVVDQGTGIPDMHKTVIFERFKRGGKTGVKGTGLGLAIVKRIVEIHRGRVWVEDNPEGGSIFYVKLPKGG